MKCDFFAGWGGYFAIFGEVEIGGGFDPVRGIGAAIGGGKGIVGVDFCSGSPVDVLGENLLGFIVVGAFDVGDGAVVVCGVEPVEVVAADQLGGVFVPEVVEGDLAGAVGRRLQIQVIVDAEAGVQRFCRLEAAGGRE